MSRSAPLLTATACLLAASLAHAQPIALVQGLSGVPYNKRLAEDRADLLCRELGRHFQVTELGVSYYRWRYHEWARAEVLDSRDKVVRHLRTYVDAAHRHGLEVAFSHFAAPYPGCSKEAIAARPEFRAQALDPATGKPVPSENASPFDYANPKALAYALDAWRELLELLPPFDYLFFNENCLINPRETTYYKCGFYSDAALADYRRFIGDPSARFPVREGVAAGDRTFRCDDEAVWDRYYDWRESVFTRYLQGYARVAAEVFGRSDRYKGAIYFQHKDWVGRDIAINLDEALDTPHITWLVSEYARRADDPQLQLFESVARRRGKKLSAFINVGYYHPLQPGGMRPNTPRGVRRVFEMAIGQHVDGICAYPGQWVVPDAAEYSPGLTAIWDALCTRHGMYRAGEALVGDQAGAAVGRSRILRRSSADEVIEELTDLPLSSRVARVMRAQGPMSVDGRLDDFDSSSPLQLNTPGQIAIGRSNWDGPEDLSATAYLNYDDEALHLGVRVRDDALAPLPQKMPWPPENDSVTIALAPDPPRAPMLHYGEGAYMLSASFRDREPPTFWTTVPWKGPPREGVEVIFSRADGGGYVIEMKIPWRNARIEEVRTGRRFGLKLALTDTDARGAKQGRAHRVETTMLWAGGAYRDPGGLAARLGVVEGWAVAKVE